jgi:uncharacterized RmlC-like cupin family protein
METNMRSVLIATSLCVASLALAQEHKPLLDVADTHWEVAPPVIPKGAEMTVLHGNPSAPGVFVARLKMPAGYKIPAHQHPTAEHLTIISGSFHGGMGDKLDESKGMQIKAGGFISLPAKMNHFAWTTEPSVVQIVSEGPFAMTYANSADDPSKTN